ncbi:MAG: lysophospholipid acyltransferase family protein [Planctomycetota bacterium]
MSDSESDTQQAPKPPTQASARAERAARRAVVARRTDERQAQGRNQKHLVGFRRLRRRMGSAVAEGLAPRTLAAIAKTWRVHRTGAAGLELLRADAPLILSLWHGRMLTLMPMRDHARRGFEVLVSPSGDGSLAKQALDAFGYRVIRGSLSRGGARAMREMQAAIQAGGRLVITPDGPRGPRHSVNVGPIWLARATGAPVVSISVAMSRAWRFRSWDRMCVPKPFAKLAVHYSDPITVAPDASDASLERIAEQMRAQMIASERAAFETLDVPHDHGDAEAAGK